MLLFFDFSYFSVLFSELVTFSSGFLDTDFFFFHDFLSLLTFFFGFFFLGEILFC